MRSRARLACLRWQSAFIVGALALLAACANAPPAPHTASGAGARLGQAQASDVTLQAMSLVGTPYRFGGNTPQTGFDCSGLIAYVYLHSAAIPAPRTVSALSAWGQAVASTELRSGDLVVFAPLGVATHAGIYVGDGRFVHAPSSGGEVRLDSLSTGYWSRQAQRFRRP